MASKIVSLRGPGWPASFYRNRGLVRKGGRSFDGPLGWRLPRILWILAGLTASSRRFLRVDRWTARRPVGAICSFHYWLSVDFASYDVLRHGFDLVCLHGMFLPR